MALSFLSLKSQLKHSFLWEVFPDDPTWISYRVTLHHVNVFYFSAWLLPFSDLLYLFVGCKPHNSSNHVCLIHGYIPWKTGGEKRRWSLGFQWLNNYHTVYFCERRAGFPITLATVLDFETAGWLPADLLSAGQLLLKSGASLYPLGLRAAVCEDMKRPGCELRELLPLLVASQQMTCAGWFRPPHPKTRLGDVCAPRVVEIGFFSDFSALTHQAKRREFLWEKWCLSWVIYEVSQRGYNQESFFVEYGVEWHIFLGEGESRPIRTLAQTHTLAHAHTHMPKHTHTRAQTHTHAHTHSNPRSHTHPRSHTLTPALTHTHRASSRGVTVTTALVSLFLSSWNKL